jgi:hypothetical protein
MKAMQALGGIRVSVRSWHVDAAERPAVSLARLLNTTIVLKLDFTGCSRSDDRSPARTAAPL